jgi:hypothetical protein
MNAITTPPALALLDAGAKPTRLSRTAAMALTVALVAVIAWFDYTASLAALTKCIEEFTGK